MPPLATDPVTLTAATAILSILGVSIALHVRRRRYSTRTCGRSGPDPSRFRVVVGNPDALFRDRGNGRLIVGEAKSRNYKSAVTPYGRYQVTLYIGMVERRPSAGDGDPVLRQRAARSARLRRGFLQPPACVHPPMPADYGLNAPQRQFSSSFLIGNERESPT